MPVPPNVISADMVPPTRGHWAWPAEHYTTPELVLTYLIPWHMVSTFAMTMLGDAVPGVARAISRPLAKNHPQNTNLFCREVNLLEGKGAYKDDGNGMIAYFDNADAIEAFGVFECKFARPRYVVTADAAMQTKDETTRFTITDTRDSVESIPYPGKTFFFKDNFSATGKYFEDAWKFGIGFCLPANEQLSTLRTMKELTWTVVAVPDALIGAAGVFWGVTEGKINANPVGGYARGQVLFLPVSAGAIYGTPSGAAVRDVRFSLLARSGTTTDGKPITWNHFFTRTGGFGELITQYYGGVGPGGIAILANNPPPGAVAQPFTYRDFTEAFFGF